MRVQGVDALEILDSRGRPTVLAWVTLENGVRGSASVPSGASTGQAEAWELRDGDPARYDGRGCLKAVAAVRGEIADALRGQAFETHAALDERLIALDGTPNKARLGANSILAVSLAYARAMAAATGVPLYRYFAAMVGNNAPTLPVPMINLFSGGKHAGGQVAFQDLLIVSNADTVADMMQMATEIYSSAAELIGERYGMRLLRADEGGLAPPFQEVEDMFGLANEAMSRAEVRLGIHMSLALDAAASHFYNDGKYIVDGKTYTSDELADFYAELQDDYGLVGVEDGLAEEDWSGWQRLNARLGNEMMIIGDDLLCTNPTRIRRAITQNAANALLLKVNQIGTLTEAAESLGLARMAGWRVIASARSGETEDNWLADLAVGWSADYIKIGSVTQSDRLAKYNRLLMLEHEGLKFRG